MLRSRRRRCGGACGTGGEPIESTQRYRRRRLRSRLVVGFGGVRLPALIRKSDSADAATTTRCGGSLAEGQMPRFRLAKRGAGKVRGTAMPTLTVPPEIPAPSGDDPGDRRSLRRKEDRRSHVRSIESSHQKAQVLRAGQGTARTRVSDHANRAARADGPPRSEALLGGGLGHDRLGGLLSQSFQHRGSGTGRPLGPDCLQAGPSPCIDPSRAEGPRFRKARIVPPRLKALSDPIASVVVL